MDTLKSEGNWEELVELIDHIVATHHKYLQAELPILNQFVTKIARVHGPNDGEALYELEKYYIELKDVLEKHLAIEEEILFPKVRGIDSTPSDSQMQELLNTIGELEQLHEASNLLLQKMREVTSNYTLPEHACRTYTTTFTKLEELENDLFTHLQLEQNILIPRIISVRNLTKFD